METVRKIAEMKLRFLGQWWPILTFMWCVAWFTWVFTPLEQSDAAIRQISHNTYQYINISRKPFPSVFFCQIEGSKLITETNLGVHVKDLHRTPRWGTGDNDWTIWKVEGHIPVGAEVVQAHKELIYRCLGFFFKKVSTPPRILDVD